MVVVFQEEDRFFVGNLELMGKNGDVQVVQKELELIGEVYVDKGVKEDDQVGLVIVVCEQLKNGEGIEF